MLISLILYGSKKKLGKNSFLFREILQSIGYYGSMILALSLAYGVILSKYYFTSLAPFFSYEKGVASLFYLPHKVIVRIEQVRLGRC